VLCLSFSFVLYQSYFSLLFFTSAAAAFIASFPFPFSIWHRFRYNAYEISPYNFDTFTNAFGTIFQVLTFDNWDDVMHAMVRATGWQCLIYLFSMVLFGSYIILNLFFAILLGDFSDDEVVNREVSDADSGGDESRFLSC